MSIRTVVLPQSVQTIGVDAFLNCCYISSITVPTSCQRICDSAFEGCSSLREIILPQGIRSLGKGFISRTSIKTLQIPKTIEAMSFALSGADHLEQVVFEEGIKQIPAKALIAEERVASKKLVVHLPRSLSYLPLRSIDASLMVIQCYENSYAHKFAIENCIDFLLQ